MAVTLFSKLGHHYSEANFASTEDFVQLLEHVDDFQKISMVALLFFKMKPNSFYKHVFITINIPCKFGEGVFINDQEIKVYVKNMMNRCMDRQMHAWMEGASYSPDHGLQLQAIDSNIFQLKRWTLKKFYWILTVPSTCVAAVTKLSKWIIDNFTCEIESDW